MSRTGSLLFRNGPRVAWSAAARGERRRQRRQWCASAVLGAIVFLGSGTASTTGPGTTAPVDRTVVAIPPVYPGSLPGFLRLPETQSLPAGSTAVPGFGGPGPIAPGIHGDRPVWSPARLEPVVGIDAQGRITSILEYTPGRFER